MKMKFFKTNKDSTQGNLINICSYYLNLAGSVLMENPASMKGKI